MTNRHLLLLFAQVASFNSNWFGTKMIDFPTKSHSFQANFGTKTQKLRSCESKIYDFWCFVRKISLETGIFGAKPISVKGGNSGKQQQQMSVCPRMISEFMYNLISRIQWNAFKSALLSNKLWNQTLGIISGPMECKYSWTNTAHY